MDRVDTALVAAFISLVIWGLSALVTASTRRSEVRRAEWARAQMLLVILYNKNNEAGALGQIAAL
jgi:hypothetical protein